MAPFSGLRKILANFQMETLPLKVFFERGSFEGCPTYEAYLGTGNYETIHNAVKGVKNCLTAPVPPSAPWAETAW